MKPKKKKQLGMAGSTKSDSGKSKARDVPDSTATKILDAKQTLSLLAQTYLLNILNWITLILLENMRNFENSNN